MAELPVTPLRFRGFVYDRGIAAEQQHPDWRDVTTPVVRAADLEGVERLLEEMARSTTHTPYNESRVRRALVMVRDLRTGA
jgi:hypothetical protein